MSTPATARTTLPRMALRSYQVDAFASRPFTGNPASVVPLDVWPDDATLQSIAAEHNLSETAFVDARPNANGRRRLRWCTPTVEVDLCGHATLATAFVLREVMGDHSPRLAFDTRSGVVSVERDGALGILDFPALAGEATSVTSRMERTLGVPVEEARLGAKLLLRVESESAVAAIARDDGALADLSRTHAVGGVIVTAPGDRPHFVSRYFAPLMGVPEDPVTGSSHCMLVPYWAEKVGHRRFAARQISTRGGMLSCELVDSPGGQRVRIGGTCVLYSECVIRVPIG